MPDQDQQCRLCGGSLRERFTLVVLGKHRVRYFECADCDSLQTERPYWLAEAYGASNLSRLDTGAAQRNIHNFAACYAMATVFGATDVVDVGGGDGLLCRLLRDYEINCRVSDKYATPTYAQGYTAGDADTPQMAVSFEVWEHYADPGAEIERLFALGADVYLVSTELYARQGADWWYLAPASGQHLFFYSRKAVRWIADRHGYTAVVAGGFVLFVRGASNVKVRIARTMLRYRMLRLLLAWLALRPARGAWKDHLVQLEMLREQAVAGADNPSHGIARGEIRDGD